MNPQADGSSNFPRVPRLQLTPRAASEKIQGEEKTVSPESPLRLVGGMSGADRPLVGVLCADPDRREGLSRLLEQFGFRTRQASCARELALLREALRAGRNTDLDAVVMDDELPDASAPDLAQVLRWQNLVVVAWHQGTQASTMAMRVFASVMRSRGYGGGGEHGEARGEGSSLRAVRPATKDGDEECGEGEEGHQTGAAFVDLVQAYEEFALHMNQLTTANEYGALIRSELDIESLLRATLEFLLGRSGPTNAAVFLPTTTGDFSLGAYVNYDCPRETVDILLDHMANVIAPRFEDLRRVVHLSDAATLDRYIGTDADWLGESAVMAVACRAERETLAIILLFRDRHIPFTMGLSEQLQTVADLFGRQLSKVIHIHHRHLPKHKWGLLGDHDADTGDDYGDLAA